MNPEKAATLHGPLIQEMWCRGIVGAWYLKPKQKTVLDFLRVTDDPFFEASRRYGKTTTVLGYIMEEMGTVEDFIVRWCEPWKNQCREIVMTEVDQIQKGILYRDRLKFKGTDSHYEHPKTGAKLYLRGVNEDRGESARGTKAHIIVADELGSWREPQYILEQVLGPQLLTTNGKLIPAGTPPRNLTHYFYDMKEEAKGRGAFIQRLIHDQEIATQEAVEKAVERAGGWTSAAVRREYLCEKIIDKNYAIIPEWRDEMIKATPRDEFFPFWLKYAGLDIGVRDLTVVLLAYYDWRRAKLVVLDEIVMNGPEMTTEKLAIAQRAKEKVHFNCEWEEVIETGRPRWRLKKMPYFRMRRVSDIDLLLVNDLSALHGLYYEATDKGSLEEMVNEVRVWVAGDKLEVHPDCVNLIDCLRYGVWDEDRKQWERSDRLGHFDGLAALMYLIRNVDRQTNPIPADYGKPADDWFIPVSNKEERREKIKKMFNIQNRR